jgi:hypothetical protein
MPPTTRRQYDRFAREILVFQRFLMRRAHGG